jgi:GntR family transcriptional repressor for pyruvate dehydrogenase complex
MGTQDDVYAKTSNLVDYVQQQILDIILSGKYDDKGYIKSEGELCKEFNVSRVTVREAIRALEVRGFVERIHGKGIKVIDKSIQVVARSLLDMYNRTEHSYEEVLEVRRIIELQACRLAAIRANDKEIHEMELVLKKMQDPGVSYEQYLLNDLKFHLLIVKATKNKILESIVMSLQPMLKESILAATNPDDRPELKMKYHKKILESITEHDPDGAEENMLKHLKATEELIKN